MSYITKESVPRLKAMPRHTAFAPSEVLDYAKELRNYLDEIAAVAKTVRGEFVFVEGVMREQLARLESAIEDAGDILVCMRMAANMAADESERPEEQEAVQ